MRGGSTIQKGLLTVLAVGVLGCAAPQTDFRNIYGPPIVQPDAYARYLDGRLAALEGDNAAAEAAFAQAMRLAPEQAEPAQALAEILLLAGQRERGDALVRHVLERWPNDPASWKLAGRARASAGALASATVAFERAVALDPVDEEATLLLASSHEQAGALGAAERALGAFLARVPGAVEPLFRRGALLVAAGRTREAEPLLRRAVDVDPGHVDAMLTLATVMRRHGNPTGAAALLRDAFDRSGEDLEVGRTLLFALLDAGDRAAALAFLEGLDAPWRGTPVRVELAELHLAVRHLEGAARITEDVLERVPGYPPALLLAARVHGLEGRADAARTAALAVAEAAGEWPEAQALVSDLDARAGRTAQARERLDRALVRAPGATVLLIESAGQRERGGDVAGASRELDLALARAPGDVELRYARASLEDRTGDVERAIALIRPLLDADPDDVTALNFVGFALASRRVRLPEAERMLRRAASLSPDDGYVLDSLGWVLVQLGKHDEAQRTLERADRLAPLEPEILFHLGVALEARGERARARDTLQRALRLEPTPALRRELETRVRALEAGITQAAGTP